MSDDRSTSECGSKVEKPTTECKKEIPTAAIVSFAGEETHEFEAYGSDETDLTYRDDVEKGDELVRRSDAESFAAKKAEYAVGQAIKAERQRITELIKERIEGIDKEIERLKKGDHDLEERKSPELAAIHHQLQKQNFEELLDEVQE